MLGSALQDTRWDSSNETPPPPYMNTNGCLSHVVRTVGDRAPRVTAREEIDFFGKKIVWTKDGGRPFPKPVLDALVALASFSELEANWDSYGGRPTTTAAIVNAVRLVLLGHQKGSLPHVHPLSDGGVGLSWSLANLELEIAVAANGSAEGVLTDEARNEEIELDCDSSVADAVALAENYFGRR